MSLGTVGSTDIAKTYLRAVVFVQEQSESKYVDVYWIVLFMVTGVAVTIEPVLVTEADPEADAE